MNYSERATHYFYEYDYRLRGYWLFDSPVDIEPNYLPFQRPYPKKHNVDDGRVPSLFKRIASLVSPKEAQKEEEIPLALEPTVLDEERSLKCYRLTFFGIPEIKTDLARSLLDMLSYTENELSFEIIASHEAIHIQWTSSEEDSFRLTSQIKASFPNAVLEELNPFDLPFEERNVTIIDLGLAEESVRPISTNSNFAIDPLASLIGTMEHLSPGETALFQIIYKGVSAPWKYDLINSVSDGAGGSFFDGSPEMLPCAKEKTSSPLFSCVMRIAVQGENNEREEMLVEELVKDVCIASESDYNRLIPLPNEDYDFHQHLKNVYLRQSNRWGMLLSSDELVSFVHFPNQTVVSQKLRGEPSKTKLLPDVCIGQKYAVGCNYHLNCTNQVSFSDEQRLKHCHIIGATGVGKSTLLTRMVSEDMKSGNGCAVLDPHGDLIEDILGRVPKNRLSDVILIDPSDTEYPIGFNLFQAETEAEKIVLSSDLISAFQRQSSSWGDVIHSILANAINTFLDSNRGGTIIELKRFLVEAKYRSEYLKSVQDPSLLYYWKHDYPLLKKGSLSPLLIRIDSFLQSKTIRYMLAQKDGVDFAKAVNGKKIILIKLSQGLIGEQNAYLLGTLFLSKLYQVGQGRQALKKEERSPFYLYIDEFQNFITESISQTLSGARKYGIGLTLAHQELTQIDDPKILQSVVSNPNIRICFRLSDKDGKRLEHDFSSFEADDFANLDVGQAIARVGKSTQDFSLLTEPLTVPSQEKSTLVRNHIVEQSRLKYAKAKSEVTKILEGFLPQFIVQEEKEVTVGDKENLKKESKKAEEKIKEVASSDKGAIKSEDSENSKKELIEALEKKSNKSQHRLIQKELKRCGQSCGFLSEIEAQVKGGKVDVSLKRDDVSVAIEVSVSNTPDYEIKNIEKCLEANYNYVLVVSEDTTHLKSIQVVYGSPNQEKVQFMNIQEAFDFIRNLRQENKPKTEIIKGFRVKTSYENSSEGQIQSLRKQLSQMLGIKTKHQ